MKNKSVVIICGDPKSTFNEILIKTLKNQVSNNIKFPVAFSKINLDLGGTDKNLNVETKDDGTVEMQYHKDDGSKLTMVALNNIVTITFTGADQKCEFLEIR